MDNPNPIYYKDLITPDNSIVNLIAQLKELIAEYKNAKSEIQATAAESVKSIQSLSGATEDQRKAIVSSMQMTEKLLEEYKDTDGLLKQLNAKYQDGTLALKEFTKIQKLVDTANREAEGSYNRLAAQYKLNKIRLNEMSQAERETTEAGRRLEAETKAIYERMNELQKATGKAQLQVGQYERALGGLLGVNPKIVEALTDSKKAVETFGGVVKALAGPIGIAIGAVGALVAVFKLFKESVHETQTTGDALDYAVGEWTGTWDVFKKSVSAVDFRGFIQGATDAAAAGRNLKMVLDETFERTNSAAILRASMSAENAVLQEAMRDTRKSYDERLKAADDYLANMKPIYEQETETARRNRDAQLEYLFSVTNRQKFETKEAREAEKERFAAYIRDYNLNEANIKLATQYLQARKDVGAAESALRSAESVQTNKYYDNQRKLAQARVDSATEETKAIAGLLERYNLASNEEIKAYTDAEVKYLNAQAAAYNDEKRIVTQRNNLEAQRTKEAQTQAAQRAKDAEKAEKDRLKAEEDAAKERERLSAQAIADARAVLNAQLQSIQLQIVVTQEGTEEMLALRKEMLRKQEEIELFENAQKAEHLMQDEEKIRAKYNMLILREETKFNTTIAERDLKALQDRLSAENRLIDQNERQKTIFRLEQEKARLLAVLELNKTATEKMTQAEIEAIQATIKAIDKEIKKTGYNNLYELLGIGLDSDQQSALNTAIDSMKDSIGSLIDSWNAAADAAVNAADKQIESAQKALDAEIEARNQGYAHSVETARKELELAKQNQQKALQERQKAQHAQLLLDSIGQASSLVTATANIWKTFTEMGAVGIALASIATGTMWGAFLAAKIKAAELTTPSEKYAEGTVELLQGGSHASGHDIDLGRKRDGTRRRAEGGEFFAVINKRNSRRYRSVIPDVINSFNDGTFAERYQRASDVMSGYAVSMAGTDVSGLERDVAAIRQQGDHTQFVDGKGNVIMRYKNLTRKIKS